MRTETDPTAHIRLVGVSSEVAQDPGSTEPSTGPELPRPFYMTLGMLEMVESWAANSVNHGVDAWPVLAECLAWRARAER